MSDALARSETAVLELLADAMRGPRRNGLFALWLVLRVAGDLLPPHPTGERNHRRRVTTLRHRLQSLPLSPPLRRGLVGALQGLEGGTPQAASVALHQLVAPVRETLGSASAEAVARAARTAQRAGSA